MLKHLDPVCDEDKKEHFGNLELPPGAAKTYLRFDSDIFAHLSANFYRGEKGKFGR